MDDVLKSAFDRYILLDNINRLKFLSIVLLAFELVIYPFRDRFFGAGDAMLGFIILNAVMVAPTWLIARHPQKIDIRLVKLLQNVYAFGALAFGIALTLATTGRSEMVHMFFMMVFGVSLVICMHPTESLLLIATAFLVLSMLLPSYQPDANVVLVTQINSFIFCLVAWIQSRLQYNLRKRQFVDQENIQRKNRQLEDSVRRDATTGLLNYAHIQTALQEAMQSAADSGHSLAILLLDLDDLSAINTKAGYLAGDDVIARTAELIRKELRSSDEIGRLCGGLFLAVLPETSLTEAVAAAQSVMAGLNVAHFPEKVWVSLSCGIAVYQGQTLENLLQTAAENLKTAKINGKNRIEFNPADID